MKVSVIIPTFNEANTISDCLRSLEGQSFKDFEVLVVDDGSSDGTPKVVTEFSSEYPLRFFRQNHKGAGSARNLGTKHARGEILVFVDGDMTFEKSFIGKLIKPIVEKGINGTFSKEEYVSNWDNVWSRCWNINEGWVDRRRHPENYPDKQPVFRAILKSEFQKVGGFDPGGYTDDWSLGKKLGYEAVSAKGAKFYHKNPDNLGEVFFHARWVGKRKYKFGPIGSLFALLRASLPVSVFLGLTKSLLVQEPRFFIFKVIYDFGIFWGVIHFLLTGKGSK